MLICFECSCAEGKKQLNAVSLCAQVHFEFPVPTELSSASLLQLNDASFKYPNREDFGLKDLNIGIDMGSRVAIVGPNGAGKTTLMNLLAGLSLLREIGPANAAGVSSVNLLQSWQTEC